MSAFIISAISLWLIYKLLYWFTHRRPLTQDEVAQLSKARRILYINSHFNFVRTAVGVNPQYRASLNANGRWDKVSIPLNETLALLTQLLRYKRHEWSVWCLCDDMTCKYIWANKGDDNESCYFKGSMVALYALAIEEKCTTLIHMHNHPHTQDIYWNLLSPSETDLKTLQHQKENCEKVGINYIDALCSQGSFIIFGYLFPKDFVPPETSIDEIQSENGLSKKKNYSLHKELKKIKRIDINI